MFQGIGQGLRGGDRSMRAVVQRVNEASVLVDGETVGAIGVGLAVLLGAEEEDSDEDLSSMLDKILNLRVFEDSQGRMNLSLLDVGGELLVISQFTLLGDCRRGRRPSFTKAMKPEQAQVMLAEFVRKAGERGVHVESGEFGAMMSVRLENWGPVTLILDSRKRF